MSQGTTILLGAIAGLTIFLGLPIARMRGLSRQAQGFLNAVATGILIFLLWDVLTKATEPVDTALAAVHKGQPGQFAALVAVFVVGFGGGLLSLVYFNSRIRSRLMGRQSGLREGPGAAVAADMAAPATGQTLAVMIATGLGLHNFSEGLAIGQSAATGAIAFAGVLIIGFALHNITEGFGIAAPLASDAARPSWGFLALAGLLGGGPTFLGTMVGYSFTSPYVFVLFLTLAAGAIVYVVYEMFGVGRRMNSPAALGWGIFLGFVAGYGTDLLLTYLGS